MLQIEIPISPEGWDEEKQEFVEPKIQTLQLEHSLISLSKWESKWKKTFLSKKSKTYEEVIDYVRCMTLTPNVSPDVYNHITRENIQEVENYIGDPMSAVYFKEDKTSGTSREPVTSEVIYYWMISLNIPFECQKWHLNRLLTLIKVCNVKNTPPKKRKTSDIAREYASLNAERKRMLNTKG